MDNINKNFEYLNIGLPEDILRRKTFGDFDGALKLIEKRLNTNITPAMRSCLIVEQELIKRLPSDYPYTEEQAIALVKRDIPDFTRDEFLSLVDDNKIDWIFVNGKEHYFDGFYSTLIKVNPAFAERANISRGFVDGDDGKKDEDSHLGRVIRLMKKNGHYGVKIQLEASVKIKDSSFVKGAKVKVYIPIPAQAKQSSNINLISFFPEPTYIAPETVSQRTVYWEETMQENHEFKVVYSYENNMQYVNPDAAIAKNSHPGFFLEEENPHIVFTPYIKELVRSLTADSDNPVIKAKRIYDFITTNVKYSFMRDYFGLENIPDSCARNLRGDCGVQALLFITMCRYAGIPAKWQSGLNVSPVKVGAHDWAEFYIEPFGWLFADPSFGGGAYRIGNEERRNFYFGNLDPFRMIANKKFFASFDPEEKDWRADPYDNQSGEIQINDRGLRYNEYKRSQKLITYSEIE